MCLSVNETWRAYSVDFRARVVMGVSARSKPSTGREVARALERRRVCHVLRELLVSPAASSSLWVVENRRGAPWGLLSRGEPSSDRDMGPPRESLPWRAPTDVPGSSVLCCQHVQGATSARHYKQNKSLMSVFTR